MRQKEAVAQWLFTRVDALSRLQTRSGKSLHSSQFMMFLNLPGTSYICSLKRQKSSSTVTVFLK